MVTPPLASEGFRFRRRDAAFHRERHDVSHLFALGISSRPAQLGRVGISVQPFVNVDVERWRSDAEQRLASATGPLVHWEHPSAAVVAVLDWIAPGQRSHWALPDEPTTSDVERVGEDLRRAVIGVGLPFMKRLKTPDLVLDSVAAGDVRVLQGARFTLACGALLAGRPELARTVIEPFGTARRESVAGILGL
jgi:hypothetical protein